MSFDVEWDKIIDKPEKDHKILGQTLLNMREKITMQEKMLAELNYTLNTSNQEKQGLTDEIAVRNQKILELVSQQIPELNAQVEAAKGQLAGLSTEIEGYIAKNSRLMQENDELKIQLKTTESLVQERDTRLKEFKDGLVKYESRIKMLEKEINDLKDKTKDQASSEEMRSSIQEEFEKELKALQEKVLSDEELEEIEKLKKMASPEAVEEMLMERDDEIDRLSALLKEKETQIAQLSSGAPAAARVKARPGKKPEPPPATVKPKAKPVKEAPSKFERQPAPAPAPAAAKFSVFTDGPSGAVDAPQKEGTLNPKVAQIFENLTMAIKSGIKARELSRILEDSRDEIANVQGFSTTLNEIGKVARKLKGAPPNAQIDTESVNVFIEKLDEWKERMKK